MRFLTGGNSHHTLAGMAPGRHLIQGPLLPMGKLRLAEVTE